MAPAYKLIYFNVCGFGETTRYLFNYGGIEFEDIRFEDEEWPQWKAKLPFGVVPVLEHNGKQISQSIAIARYLAKKVKLAGNDDWEDLEIDAIVNTVYDLYLKILPIYYEHDATKKKALLETALKEALPYYLPRLEAIVQKNNGHLALGRLTWADLHWASLSPIFDLLTGKDNLDNFPNLKTLREKVNELPPIKKWIEIRPKTEM